MGGRNKEAAVKACPRVFWFKSRDTASKMRRHVIAARNDSALYSRDIAPCKVGVDIGNAGVVEPFSLLCITLWSPDISPVQSLSIC